MKMNWKKAEKIVEKADDGDAMNMLENFRDDGEDVEMFIEALKDRAVSYENLARELE